MIRIGTEDEQFPLHHAENFRRRERNKQFDEYETRYGPAVVVVDLRSERLLDRRGGSRGSLALRFDVRAEQLVAMKVRTVERGY